MKKIYLIILLIFNFIIYSKPKIGVTMLPYYSYVANIVGDKMDVVPIIPQGANVHTYSPSVADMKALTDIDIVVINGIGHDDFVNKMIEIAKKTNNNIKVINANETANIIYTQGQKFKGAKNPHTFISVTQSIQQINHIARMLAKLDEANAKEYINNARKYSNKLRKIKFDSLKKLNKPIINTRVATTHAGYDYILLEFGITVAAVVEPSHGKNPSATDIKDSIEKIKKENIHILFDETVSNNKNAMTIQKETSVYVTQLDHMTNAEYTKDAFEILLKKNLDTIVDAIISTSN